MAKISDSWITRVKKAINFNGSSESAILKGYEEEPLAYATETKNMHSMAFERELYLLQWHQHLDHW